MSGPAPWNSTVVNAGVTLPLFGWYFQGEFPDNVLSDPNISGIDQLDGIRQQSLPPVIGCGQFCN